MARTCVVRVAQKRAAPKKPRARLLRLQQPGRAAKKSKGALFRLQDPKEWQREQHAMFELQAEERVNTRSAAWWLDNLVDIADAAAERGEPAPQNPFEVQCKASRS